jgi:hypothetical protein
MPIAILVFIFFLSQGGNYASLVHRAPASSHAANRFERVQQKWAPVLRKAIKLARIAYTYPRTRSNLLS